MDDAMTKGDKPISPDLVPVFTAWLRSSNQFPVDFCTARTWLHDRAKRNAVSTLKLLDPHKAEYVCKRMSPPQGGMARDVYSLTVDLYMRFAERSQTPNVYALLVSLREQHHPAAPAGPAGLSNDVFFHTPSDGDQSPAPTVAHRATQTKNKASPVGACRKRQREADEVTYEASMASHRALMAASAIALAKQQGELEVEQIAHQVRITNMIKEALGDAYTEEDRRQAERRIRDVIAAQSRAAVD